MIAAVSVNTTGEETSRQSCFFDVADVYNAQDGRFAFCDGNSIFLHFFVIKNLF